MFKSKKDKISERMYCKPYNELCGDRQRIIDNLIATGMKE